MRNNLILMALKGLIKEIKKSFLNEQQKNALKVSIDKLITYYNNKIKEIDNTTNFYVAKNKELKLTSVMTDHIVLIDHAIKGMNDPFYVTNSVNKTVNRVEKKKLFKIKRLT